MENLNNDEQEKKLYKLPLCYSPENETHEEYFDSGILKVLLDYNFFIEYSNKASCMHSETIAQIFRNEGYSANYIEFIPYGHFICYVDVNNIRYYIDNETKHGYGVIFLRISGSSINDSEDILKKFYNSNANGVHDANRNSLLDCRSIKRYKEYVKENHCDILDNLTTYHKFNSSSILNVNCDKKFNKVKTNIKQYPMIINESVIDELLFDEEDTHIPNFYDYKNIEFASSYESVLQQIVNICKNQHDVSNTIEIKKIIIESLFVPTFALQVYEKDRSVPILGRIYISIFIAVFSFITCLCLKALL
jgi:hypothetical protein